MKAFRKTHTSVIFSPSGKHGRRHSLPSFGPLHGKCRTPGEVADLISDNFYALDKFFLSLTQSRRVRAGTAFEVLIREFFRLLKYPFTPQPRIDGNPDFVLPSVEHYEADPLNVIIFTVKRSLRERWRQIVTEGAKGLGFYLATIDPGVSAVDLKAMQKQKIFLVVPATFKKKISPLCRCEERHNV